MNAVSVMIKPSSSGCNLGCKYCFYYDVAANREHKSFGFMNDETLENLIMKTFKDVTHQVTFAFQGGEPTLIGLDYFRKFIDLVAEYNTDRIPINYAIQTNGTLLDDEFCDFLGKHKFLVGLSMDGPKEIHDLNRLDQNRKGTFKLVDRAAKLLNKHSVDFNILTVVTKGNATHVHKIYSYFKKQKYNYMQFIPCINDFNDPVPKPYSLTPEIYGKFLVDLFDLWYDDIKSGRQVSIRMFDNYVQMMLGMPPESCDMNGFCSVNAIVEADGSIYPCDFYVLDQWKLGNINESGLEELYNSPAAKAFVQSGNHTDEKCKNCQYYQLCRSGCRRHKEMESNKLVRNYFCDSYIYFFDHCYSRIREIAHMVARNYSRPNL